MNTYRVEAQNWQLKAAAEGTLNKILMPYPKELLKKGGPESYYEWIIDEPTVCPYAPGDLIFFAENWCKGDWGAEFDDDIYFTQSTTPEAELIGWQPAETMPEEAARYWFKVTAVKIISARDMWVQCDQWAILLKVK
jgi:hypothetical protein